MTWVAASLLLSCAAHLMLALTSLSPLPAIITMGLTYSVLSSALWSLPCLMVSQNKLATAFGIMQVIFQSIYLVSWSNIISLARLCRISAPR